MTLARREGGDCVEQSVRKLEGSGTNPSALTAKQTLSKPKRHVITSTKPHHIGQLGLPPTAGVAAKTRSL